MVVDCRLRNTNFPVGKLFTIAFYTELLGPFPDLPNVLLVENNANTWTTGSQLGMRLVNYRRLVQLHSMWLVKLLVLGVLTNTQVALIVSLVPRLFLYTDGQGEKGQYKKSLGTRVMTDGRILEGALFIEQNVATFARTNYKYVIGVIT